VCPLRRPKKHQMGGTCQSFYRLCHTGATMEKKMATSRMVENGMSVFQVSLITGHKSMSMVRRYAHLKQAVNPALTGHK